jgi:uncharacterized protein (DUF1800 family)
MPDLSAHNGVLGERLAGHLLRRALFGTSRTQITNFASKNVSQAVDELLTFTAITDKPIDHKTGSTWVDDLASDTLNSEDFNLRRYVIAWYLQNVQVDNTVRSKMILFLYQCWTVNVEDSWNSEDFYDYLKLLEFYSLGSYKTLSVKMCRNLRMLVFLNGFENTGTSPNENYAREFLELFTIGKGPQISAGNYTNYTETDVQQAAKLLSGYTYWLTNTNKDADTNIRHCAVNTSRHSPVNKTFSAAFSNKVIAGGNTELAMQTELTEFVNMIFDQDETAKNICRKLYRFFVQRKITASVEADIIAPLAIMLKNNNYDLKVALGTLLKSKHFYDLDDGNASNNIIGGMVKNPVELYFSAVKYFGLHPNNSPTAPTLEQYWHKFYVDGVIETFLRYSGMRLFDATTVAGYPALYEGPNYDKLWFNNSTITQRYFFGRILLENKFLPYNYDSTYGLKLDITTWVKSNISDPKNGAILVDEMLNYMLPEKPSTQRRDYFLNSILLGSLTLANWQTEWQNYIATNDNTGVKSKLENLLKSIIYSQEFQLN